MKPAWIGLPLLAVSWTLLTPNPVRAAVAAAAPSAAASPAQDRAWDTPPDAFRDVQRQGFHDGIEAAKHDYETHRRSDADDHDAFRHPRVPRDERDEYRDGFRIGYAHAIAHMNGVPDHY
jgi:hypothetical protein